MMADGNQFSVSSKQQVVRFDGVTKEVLVRTCTGDELDYVGYVFLDGVSDFLPNVTGFSCQDQQLNFLFDRDSNRLSDDRIIAVSSKVSEAHEPKFDLQSTPDDALDKQLMELSQKLNGIECRSDDCYQQLNEADGHRS